MSAYSSTLSYGMYFGSGEVCREVPGFSVSVLTPVFRAEEVPLHTHASASFVLVLSGAYRSGADGATQSDQKPMLLFNPAGTTHRDSFSLASGRFAAVSISDESLRVATDGALLPTAAKTLRSGDAIRVAMRLARTCVHPEVAGDAALEANCWELLGTLCGVQLWPLPDAPHRWINQARELLHERCSDSMHLGELASELGVHPVSFARAFRRVFRCTPGEYRLRCRLHGAVERMRNSRAPLAEIAGDAGFFDQSHFSGAFQEHFGTSPGAYRQQLGGR